MRNRRIFIIGAGEVGYHIAHSLVREGYDLVVIDKDLRRVEELQRSLDVLAVHGDGTNRKLLEEKGVGEARRFFAVTNSDSVNVLAALTARRLGAGRCLVRIGFSSGPVNPLVEDDPEIQLINPGELVAQELLALTKVPGASRVHFFEQGRLVLLHAKTALSARHLYGRPLRELDWPEGWVLTGVVPRAHIQIPSGDTFLQPNQPIYAVGRTDQLEAFERFLGIEVKSTRRVVIAGAGQVGSSLCTMLAREGIKVTVVERDEARAFALAAAVPEAVVLLGDATDPALLREADVDQTDFFVAATQDDMTNVLSSLLARELGAHTEVALYNRPEFRSVMKASGIDLPLSPRTMIAGTILRTVHRREILSLDLVGGGDAEVIDFEVPKKARILGRPLKDLKLPNSVVAAVVREEDIIIPGGEFRFEPGDHVLIFTLVETLPFLERQFKRR